MPSSIRAADFVGSLGINAHLAQLNASTTSAKTVAALRYLGIDHVRDAAAPALLQGSTIFSTLADAGVKFDMLLPAGYDPIDSINRIAQFVQAHPGSVTAVEGPNEIDHWPVTYGGMTGVAGAVAFLSAAIGAAKTTFSLASVDTYNLTGAGRAAIGGDDAGFVNIHPYPKLGAQPYTLLYAAIARNGVPGKGVVITEAGYHTGTGNATWEGVDQITQAKLTLNLVADAAKLGVAHTYLYQLLDYADPSGAAVDKNIGLFTASFQPKLAATALHNLTNILADNTATSGSFSTHDLNYSLSGAPAGGNSLLLEKANGVHDIMLWSEPDIWNEVTHSAIAVAGTTETLDFGQAVDVRVYDPLLSDQPIASYSQVSSITVSVSDHPLIVEVVGGSIGPSEQASAKIDSNLWLDGTSGADTIVGGSGDDILKGLAGNDRLYGGDGADTLKGGSGADLLTGGAGPDSFVFETINDSPANPNLRDEIMDFSMAQGDRVDLSRIDANHRLAGNDSFYLGGGQFTHHAGELVQSSSGDGILLQGDINGDGRADFAVLLHHLTQPLLADYFIL